jgi:putative ABC transport system permease protein
VVGDVHNNDAAAETRPEIYIPFSQLPWASMNLVVRTSGDPHRFAAAIVRAVLAVDPDQPVTKVLSMEEVLANGTAEPRFLTTLVGALAAIALLLALVGICGAVAYAVGERTREVGIRMALGAGRGDILRLMLRQGLAPAAVGIVLGIAASLLLTRLMGRLLYHVSATDPAVFAGAALLFAAVALAASYIPARRASSVDPVIALR